MMEASELKEILEQHKLWIKTNGAEGKRADLGGANLSGAYLRGADLRDANLGGANLEYADLGDANLSGANLSGANLGHAYLGGADLPDANLGHAYLTDANLTDADLTGADLGGANLGGAYLNRANLSGAIGLPDISWIIPGCLSQLNKAGFGFYLEKEGKWDNFIQDSIGFFIQENSEEKTFDMLLGDRIIRNIPDWVKYSGMKQIESESV